MDDEIMIDSSAWQHKSAVRAELAKVRTAIGTERRKIGSAAACGQAKQLIQRYACQRIMIYIAFRSELDLTELAEWCWQSGKEVIVPRCVERDRSMTLHIIESWAELRPGAYGIMEPDGEVSPALPPDIIPDVIFVPGLAFDVHGGRMGYGGGYYDRFAARLAGLDTERAALWIGAAFERQLVDRVPLEGHDLILDGVVTEQTVYITNE